MKLTHKICGAVLLASLGVAAAGPAFTANPAKAEEATSAKGAGEVVFTEEDTSTSDTGVVPPTSTETTSEPGSLPNGKFIVQRATKLDFDRHEVSATGSYWAKAYTFQDASNNTVKRGNYVQFKDTREQDKHTYRLQANLTTQFHTTIGANTYKLNGATITYNNGYLAADLANEDVKPDVNKALVSKGVVLKENEAATILENTDDRVGYGKGKYAVYFGLEGSADKPEESIKLDFGSKADARTGTYTAEVTWTLADLPVS